MSIPRFGVNHPVPVNLLMAVLLIAGIFSGITMTREFFPETNPESCTISFVYPGATPEEIEESLVRKIEDAVADLDEVDQIRSSINEGGGVVAVEFREGLRDARRATDEVEREVDALTDIPADVERITVTEFEPVLPTIMVSVFGDADEESLKRTIRSVRDDLETLPGMGQMVLSGVRDYEVRVDVDPDRLVEYGLTLPEVGAAIGNWLRDVPGGSVRTESGNINVRARGVEESAAAIRDIAVRGVSGGGVVRVRDLATVRDDYVDTQIRTRFANVDGSGPTSQLTVYKVGDQDAVRIAGMVRAYVAGRRVAAGLDPMPGDETVFDEEPDLRRDPAYAEGVLDRAVRWMDKSSRERAEKKGKPAPPRMRTARQQAWELGLEAGRRDPMPDGVAIATASDLARFIEGRLDLLLRNAFAGAILVFATLLIFLNWRTAFWVGVGLTTALAGTLLFMTTVGVTLNLLTMFGLIVVLGLLVDDAIVVAENIQARHEGREPALSAAIRGTEQVFWPVVATVLTSIVAFSPLTFIKGQIGDLLGALPWVVACALLMSLLESTLILPSHMGHSLVKRDRAKPSRVGKWLRTIEDARDRILMQRIVPAFGRVLQLAIRFRYISVSIAAACLIMSFGMVAGGRINFVFLPTSDSETIVIEMRMPIGTALDRTEEFLRIIESAATSQPETKSISTLIGVVASVDDTSGVTSAGEGSHLGQLFVELLPVESRTRQSQQVISSIREAAGRLDGIESLSFSEIQGGPAGKDITVQVSGDSQEEIDEVVESIKFELAQLAGVYDIADDNAAGQREVRVNLLPGAATLGLSTATVAGQVRASLFGFDAHVFSERREDIDVRVRLDERSRRSLHTIETMWIGTPSGHHVPLEEVATLVEGESYNAIRRVDRKRAVSVTADVDDGLSPETIVPALEPAFERLRLENPGVGIETAGRQRQMRKAFGSLPVGFAAACIMIYVILAWLFASYTQPIAVMLAIPFATIGVIWGHFVMGYAMTFLSLIGFVALSGIVVNDSLILVKFANRERERGVVLGEALVSAGRARFRAIMLTTITTVLGLTPLMFEQSFQAKFLIPMAVSIAFGLMSATVLILLILPCVLMIFDDARRLTRSLWQGRWERPGDRESQIPPPAVTVIED